MIKTMTAVRLDAILAALEEKEIYAYGLTVSDSSAHGEPRVDPRIMRINEKREGDYHEGREEDGHIPTEYADCE
jgi:hypothetical protein